MILIDEKHADVARFRGGEKKLNDLRSELVKKQNELNDATTRYLEQQKANKSPADCEAEQLLNNDDSAGRVTPEQVRELTHEIGIYERAISMQNDAVAKLRTIFSTVVCATVRPRYVAIESRIAKAVKELAEANEAEIMFFSELRDVDATPYFRPMRVDAVGTLSDTQSRASAHQREVAQYLPEAAA